MTKIALLSDIHMEMHRDHGLGFIESLDPKDVDILVLAGDICYLKEHYWVKEIYTAFCDKYKDVVMVPGNHCYYTSDPKICWNNLLAVQMGLSNLHVLDLGLPKIIQERRFIGGTMWFKDQPDNFVYSNLLNDFRLIKNFVPWVYNQNKQTVQNLQTHLQADDIVVTHHLPSQLSVHPKYKMSSLNRFFVCELDNLIISRRPNIWYHGHTHESTSYTLGQTRVVCNPVGYIGEGKDVPFNEHLTVEV